MVRFLVPDARDSFGLPAHTHLCHVKTTLKTTQASGKRDKRSRCTRDKAKRSPKFSSHICIFKSVRFECKFRSSTLQHII